MAAAIIVDLVLIAILVVGVILGIVCGFIKIIAKPVKFVLTFVIAFSLLTAVSDNLIQPIITAPITEQITDFVHESCAELAPENAADEIPTLLKIAAAVFDIDLEFLTSAENTEAVIISILDVLITPVITLISRIITFFILYFASGLFLTLMLFFINLLFESGALGVFNKILGVIFSTLFAFIIAWALTAIFTYVIHFPAFAEVEWAANFEGGFMYKFFNTFNPIELLLSF